MTDYLSFLKAKIDLAPTSGFEADPKELSQILKPHERDAVLWALIAGRYTLAELTEPNRRAVRA